MGSHLWEDQTFSSSMREDIRVFYEKIIRSSLMEDLLLFFAKKRLFGGLLCQDLWVFDTKTLWSSKRQTSGFYTNTFLPSVWSVFLIFFTKTLWFSMRRRTAELSTRTFESFRHRYLDILWKDFRVFFEKSFRSSCLLYEGLLDFITNAFSTSIQRKSQKGKTSDLL